MARKPSYGELGEGIKGGKVHPPEPNQLRARAEELLRPKRDEIQDIPVEDIKELIHELQVHQIELEMQNEELRRTQIELEDSRNKYFDLFDLAPIGYLTLNQEGLIQEVNLAAADLIGTERRYLTNRRFSQFIAPDFQDVFYLHRKKVFEVKTKQGCELKLFKKDGTSLDVQVESMATWDAEGNFNQLRISILDITGHKQAEEALRRHAHDLSERVKELNCLYDIFELVEKPDISLEEIIQGVLDFIPPAWQYPEITCARVSLEGQEFKTDNFSATTWKQTSDIIVYGETVGSIEVCYLEEKPEIDEGPFLKEERDLINAITERLGHIIESKKTQEMLRQSEELRRSMIDSSQDCIKLLDLEGNLKFMSIGGQKLLEIEDIKPFLDKSWIDYWKGEDRKAAIEAVSEAVEGRIGRFHGYGPTQSGQPKWWEIIISPIFGADDKVERLLSVSRDITERKRAEQELKASLKEKEVLLREIHHRVKNNLQIISSILNMSRMQTDNQEAIRLVQDAHSKVFAMGLIHTQLYQEQEFGQIDMAIYTHRLVDQLSNTYKDEVRSIHTVVEPSDVYLTLNQAIPCGLVMSELISNAFKHAFIGKKSGTIRIAVRRTDNEMIAIRVKDDGIGIPEEVTVQKPKTLGLELLRALVNQLGGTVQFNHDNGTEVNIQFEALKEEEADA